MIDEDPSLFLADFGLPCAAIQAELTQEPVYFTAILDTPATVMQLGHAAAMSVEYELTFASAAVSLTRGQQVVANGTTYTVREAPRPIDDGAFSSVLLTKD